MKTPVITACTECGCEYLDCPGPSLCCEADTTLVAQGDAAMQHPLYIAIHGKAPKKPSK